MQRLVYTALALALCAACGDDSTKQGFRAGCAASPGTFEDCAGELVTAEDVCFRLVECGNLPLDSEEGQNWTTCVDRLSNYDTLRFDYTRDCVEASSCDELVPQSDGFWPLCFRFGRQ